MNCRKASRPARHCMLSQTTKIGRYEVVSALGQGAMGTVYRAVDPLIERTVAIKTINLNLSKAELAEFEARFYREAKSAGRLNHANIVTIYDVGETGDSAYIAMEYVEGKSLREMLDSGVVLPVELITRIAARVAGALNYAHEHGVVHRDIKPANIMITSNRDVKIMDFGIAQIPTGSRTQLGTVLGSPKYMAPEQVAGRPADGRTDIFALGVVLYEMLTGTTPFNGDNLSAIMFKILNEEPAPPSSVSRRVPQVFDPIIRRALAKRPEDRYQTAREFAHDLRHPNAAGDVRAARPAQAAQAAGSPGEEPETTLFMQRRPAPSGRSAPPPRRRGMRALLAKATPRRPLLLALPLLALAVWALFLRGPHPDGQAAAPAAVAEAPAAAPRPARPVAYSVAHTAAPAPATVQAASPVHAPLREVPAARRDPAPAAAAREKGTLMLAISPWGEVYVDGERSGVSPPLTTLQLAAGTHTVEVRNQAFSPYRDVVKLEPGGSLRVRHKFR